MQIFLLLNLLSLNAFHNNEEGGFRNVYMGTDYMTNEEVAIKVEWLRMNGPPRHLLHEASIYQTLQDMHGILTVGLRSFSTS